MELFHLLHIVQLVGFPHTSPNLVPFPRIPHHLIPSLQHSPHHFCLKPRLIPHVLCLLNDVILLFGLLLFLLIKSHHLGTV